MGRGIKDVNKRENTGVKNSTQGQEVVVSKITRRKRVGGTYWRDNSKENDILQF